MREEELENTWERTQQGMRRETPLEYFLLGQSNISCKTLKG